MTFRDMKIFVGSEGGKLKFGKLLVMKLFPWIYQICLFRENLIPVSSSESRSVMLTSIPLHFGFLFGLNSPIFLLFL